MKQVCLQAGVCCVDSGRVDGDLWQAPKFSFGCSTGFKSGSLSSAVLYHFNDRVKNYNQWLEWIMSDDFSPLLLFLRSSLKVKFTPSTPPAASISLSSISKCLFVSRESDVISFHDAAQIEQFNLCKHGFICIHYARSGSFTLFSVEAPLGPKLQPRRRSESCRKSSLQDLCSFLLSAVGQLWFSAVVGAVSCGTLYKRTYCFLNHVQLTEFTTSGPTHVEMSLRWFR